MEFIEEQDDQAAIIELRNAIKLDATFAEARYQLGLLYLRHDGHRALGQRNAGPATRPRRTLFLQPTT